MNIFPDVIRVKVLNSENAKPVSKIAVSIKLFAKHKNDYGFIMPFTNLNGITEINKSWLENLIIKTKNSAIMDYSSNLEDCYPKILFEIMSEEEVKRAVKGHKLWQKAFDIKDEYINWSSGIFNSYLFNIRKIHNKVTQIINHLVPATHLGNSLSVTVSYRENEGLRLHKTMKSVIPL